MKVIKVHIITFSRNR